jgi:streptogramin lyase
MHFLVIDNRFGVPIFVFLERDPSTEAAPPALHGRWVTLEPAAQNELGFRRKHSRLAGPISIGSDPRRHDRFAEFPTDNDVRAAGFAVVEPGYVGPSWETYVGVFHPEGGKRLVFPNHRRQVVR